MNAPEIVKVVIIGAGNLAAHLSLALVHQGIEIIQVVNRSSVHGRKLAGKLGCSFTSMFDQVDPTADLYVLAVSDRAIIPVAAALKLKDAFVVHTSGTVAMDLLAPFASRYGVLYPLQTFSKRSRILFSRIPICIEAGDRESGEQLKQLAEKLSSSVHFMDHRQRMLLHLAAVFACNFTNFMYTVSEDLLRGSGISFDLLRPLIEQTARNARHDDIFRLQTGPAVREDMAVINAHQALLDKREEYLEIYNLISKRIINHKKKHG